MSKQYEKFIHPLMGWLLSRFCRPGERSDPSAQYCHDVTSLIYELGCPQTGKDAAKAHRAYRVVAEDLLGCAQSSGELVINPNGWYVLPEINGGPRGGVDDED